jgi:carboxypeptidase Q
MKAAGVVQLGYLPDPQRYFDLHHTHEDTLDKVSPREINLGAGVMAAMLYVIADLPETLPRNTVK